MTTSPRSVCALLASFVLILSISTHADEVDQYIRSEMKKRQIPGLALAVVKDGRVVKLKPYGLANIEHHVPVTSETVFDLASVTKPFTATAIMMLVEEDKLDLEDRISKHISNGPPHWDEISIRHLLTHTAGLKDEFMPTVNGSWLPDYTTAQMFEAAAKLPPNAPPGEQYRYSDMGYFLLGLVIEKVTGQRYGEFLAERIFKPLGMNSSTLLDQWAIIKNFSPGYAMQEGKLVPNRRYSQVELSPAYGILSTASDLAKWGIALTSGQLLRSTTLEHMSAPTRLNNGAHSNYGFGWTLDEIRGHRIIEHAGGTGTIIVRLPDDKLTVIVLTNLALGSSNNPRGIAQGIAAHYIPGLRFNTLGSKPDPDPNLTGKLKDLLFQIANGTENPALFVGRMSEQRIRTMSLWVKGAESFTFLACDDAGTRNLDRFGVRVQRVCYYKQTGAGETRYYRFYLTAEGKVADFWSHTE